MLRACTAEKRCFEGELSGIEVAQKSTLRELMLTRFDGSLSAAPHFLHAVPRDYSSVALRNWPRRHAGRNVTAQTRTICSLSIRLVGGQTLFVHMTSSSL
jgi:hypothetical protein